MKQAEPYQYVTPTVQSNDPRMLRAIDGWLGLYEACYVLHKAMHEGFVVKEEDQKYGTGAGEEPRPKPENLIAALVHGARALNEWNGRWVLGGGLAANYHMPERATRDVDFFLFEDKERLAPVFETLKRHGLFPHMAEAPSFMPPDADWWWVPLQYGLPDATPVNVDLLVATHEFMAFLHATGFETDINGTRARILGPEGLIVLKLKAYRGRDQDDIIGTLQKKSEKINYDLLRAWVKKFSLESRLTEMERIVKANPKRLG
jgi:predicted nucleotidyltransferase